MVIHAGHLGGNAAGGDRHSIERDLWRWLKTKYDLATVLDLGCGEGNALGLFSGLGYAPIGLDGLRRNCDAAETNPIICWDITRGPLHLSGIDLVWCCELVEHVEEEFVDNLVDMLCLGRVLAMTHGLPGQPGYHHVNCQDQEYWIDRVCAKGFKLVDRSLFSSLIRNRHFRSSGLVFESLT